MFTNFIRDGIFFAATKYLVVFVGLLRTIITAGVLTKSELGSLAAILLFFEYMTLFSPLGAIYALNKRAVNIQATVKDVSLKDKVMEDVYRSATFVIIIGLLLSITTLYVVSLAFGNLNVEVNNLIYAIVIVSILSVYRAYSVIHNRIWNNYTKIMMMELSYAFIYLLGIVIFLKNGDDGFLELYFNILITASVAAILCGGFIPKFKLNLKAKLFSYSFFRIGIALMIYNFLETFFWGVDRIFITLYLSSAQLADFHIAHTWSKGVLMAYMALTFLFTSEVMRQLTLTKDLNLNKKNETRLFHLTNASEIILAVVIIFAAIFIPIGISLSMSKYSNIDNILILVLLGLMLKGLCFFPSSYMIANNLQKRLTVLSISFSILASSIYYFSQSYIISPIEYLSISITMFLLYLIFLNIAKDRKIILTSSSIFRYKNISFIVLVMIATIYINPAGAMFSNIVFMTVLILLSYNKILLITLLNVIKFLFYRDSKFLKKIFFP